MGKEGVGRNARWGRSAREAELTWAVSRPGGEERKQGSVSRLPTVHDRIASHKHRIADSRRRIRSARRAEPQVEAGKRPEATSGPEVPRHRAIRDVGSRIKQCGRLKHGCACIR